jgi:hypothetical protein
VERGLVCAFVKDDESQVAPSVAVRELLAEESRRVKRLMDVAAEVQEPAQVHGLILLRTVLDHLDRRSKLFHDVLFVSGRLVDGRVDI